MNVVAAIFLLQCMLSVNALPELPARNPPAALSSVTFTHLFLSAVAVTKVTTLEFMSLNESKTHYLVPWL